MEPNWVNFIELSFEPSEAHCESYDEMVRVAMTCLYKMT